MPVSRHIQCAKILLAIIAAMILAVSESLLWSMVRVKREITSSAQNYIHEKTLWAAQTIDDQLGDNLRDLEFVAESLTGLETHSSGVMQTYMDRQARAMGFSSLLVMDLQGSAYQSNSSLTGLLSLPGIQDSIAGQPGVSNLEKQGILYSIPILKDGQPAGVLAGIRSQENMRQMLFTADPQDMYCIIDQTGSIILAPAQMDQLLRVDQLFPENPEGKLAEDVGQLRSDMQSRRPGLFRFDAADGSDSVLSYEPLESYGWILLTLTPSSVIPYKIGSHVSQIYWILAGVVFLLTAILIVLLVTYRQMEWVAFVDPVTGGMNDNAFRRRCASLLPKAPPGTYSVIFLHIKNFKSINTCFGSAMADDVLRRLYEILRAGVQPKGFVARSDADKFYICVQDGRKAEVRDRVQGLIKTAAGKICLIRPDTNTPHPFVLQAGAYVVDEPKLDITSIKTRVNIACCNRAAGEDGICKFYDVTLTKQIAWDQELLGAFESALENGEFAVYLQPKIWTASKTINSAEALARWNHPTRGVLQPKEFIPLFEANGCICKLDLYIFETVCGMIRQWQREGRELIPISVNLSRQHFKQPDFLEQYMELARQYEIPEQMLEFELTESIFLDENSLGMIKRYTDMIHKHGFLCSLDDFGSGYSSLGVLMEFDIDVLKLDRGFFRDIENTRGRDMIAIFVDIVREMGAISVAEGIETPQQLALAEALGCDVAQGYVFAKPMPAESFAAWADQFSAKEKQKDII